MSVLKPIGFLQEDFHSEVLDVLFELIVKNDPSRKMILYNNHDRYNNKDIYKKKYLNLVVRNLKKYIPDMVNDVCEKIIVISYDNIFHLSLLEPYKDRLIFVAHSKHHVDTFTNLQIDYFSLTNLLSRNFITPVVNNIESNFEISRYHDNKVKLVTQEILDFFKRRKQQENLDIIIIVGNFLGNNKDIDLLENLVSSKRFIILIYAPEMSDILYEYMGRHKNYVYAALRITTNEIQSNIRFLGIKYILFTPPKESKFYTSSWSGSISFAIDNDLQLIMPKTIADYYDLDNGGVISYTNVHDIISKIELNKGNEYKKYLQITRDKIYERNSKVWSTILDKNTLSIFNAKDIFKVEKSNGIECINIYKTVYDSIPELKNKLNDTSLINIDSDTTIFSIASLLFQPNCNIISFIKDLQAAKQYKNLMTCNNFLDNIKIYNSAIGNICKTSSDDSELDTFTLDSLNLKNISLIHMTSDNADDIIAGANILIKNQTPILLIKSSNITNIRTIDKNIYLNLTTNLGYKNMIIENYSIYYN
jgi:hypothetical protein